MSKPTTIYAILDPRNNEVRYVGKTINLKARILAHKHYVENENRGYTYLYRWLRKLKSNGYSPKFEILEVVDDQEWAEAEQFWITYLTFLGANLCNLSKGGEGTLGCYKSTATREKISKTKKLKFKNGEYKKGYGENNPASKLSEDIVKQVLEHYYSSKISLAELGKLFNIANISNITLGNRWKHLDWYREELIKKYGNREKIKRDFLSIEQAKQILEWYYSENKPIAEFSLFDIRQGVIYSLIAGETFKELSTYKEELINKYGERKPRKLNKLDKETVKVILEKWYSLELPTIKSLKEAFNSNTNTIKAVILGRTWKSLDWFREELIEKYGERSECSTQKLT